MTKNIDHGYILEKYIYIKKTGLLISKKSRRPVGFIVKNKKTNYLGIRIKGRNLYVHRVVYFYVKGVWPTGQIDHKDRDGTNNRWDNLREVTNLENSRNRSAYSNNKTGIPGVSWQNSISRWVSKIDMPDRRIFIGSFKDFFEACCARKSAENFYWYNDGDRHL